MTCTCNGWFCSNCRPDAAAAARVPDDLLLTETDSPFLTPHPHRGSANDPSFVPLVCEQLATVKDLSLEDCAATVADNARRAFALPSAASRAEAS